MGKNKQTKEKKFDRNVEISAPILDPEIIKAIHSPPKGQRLDIKHGGFKALLSDLNSQDSTDELTPLNDNHVPSYIGISCAVSGYSNYSSYSKRPAQVTSKTAITNSGSTPNRSRATSPVLHNAGPEVHHITLDRSTIHSADEERKELTEKLTASVSDRRRSPSPCIPPTEDDRHHGAYVGARYCPLPAPSKIVNKHIPLLGIDDEQNPDEIPEEENKVEHRIASLYGGDFVDDWRESMTHKAKKELATDQAPTQSKNLINPKDLVTLKPTPQPSSTDDTSKLPEACNSAHQVPVPNVKVLANVERQFLNKLLTDENPPVPMQPPSPAPTKLAPVSPNEIVRPDHDATAASLGGNSRIDSESAATKDHVTPVEPSTIVRDDDSTIESVARDERRDEFVENELGEKSSSRTGHDIIANDPAYNNTAQAGDDLIEIESTESVNTKVQDDSMDLIETNDMIEIEPTGTLATALKDEITMDANEATAAVSQDKILEQEQASEALVSLGSAGKSRSSSDGDLDVSPSQLGAEEGEKHIEYEIRAQSPVDNQSSPVKVIPADQSEAVCSIGEQQELEKPSKKLSMTGDQGEPLATSDSKDGRHYLDLLDREKSFILEQVARAEAILEAESVSGSDEDKIGRLRSAIGKANLLVNKKFNQFKDLCEANINRKADEQFATLNDDLAGFWDMLGIQVGDVQKSFENLWKEHEEGRSCVGGANASANDDDDHHQGQVVENVEGAREPREKAGGKRKQLSAQKDQERRERLQEHISQMKKGQAAKMSNDNLLED